MANKSDKLNGCTLESAIRNRRTIREITGGKMRSEYLEKLIWAAFGKTLTHEGASFRTAPSAGATYPVEIHVVVERIEGYDDGIYIYDTGAEKLEISRPGIFLPEVQKVSWDQEFISLSNAIFIMVYNPRKIERDYGNKSRDYALLECGHIAQNILLMATALNLGSVPVGAFSQRRLAGLLDLKEDKTPLYMVSVGRVE